MNVMKTTGIKKFSTALWAAMFCISVCISFTSCRQKELDDEPLPTIKVKVVYNWTEAPDANPHGMALFCYDSQTGESRRFDFRNLEGGTINLPEGVWHIVTYNNDSDIVQSYGHGSFLTHTAFTRQSHPLEGALGPEASGSPISADDNEGCVATPDQMWGQSRDNVTVKADPKTGTAFIFLTPHLLTCHYSYEIRNVNNLHKVVKMCGTLSGMSPELNYATEALSSRCVTLPFSSQTADASTITGEFFTFGHHPSNQKQHRMVLYLWTSDGKKLAYGTTRGNHWNVTDQVDQAPDKRRVHIIIDGLDIPVEEPVGGLTPGADDWGEEEHYIDL